MIYCDQAATSFPKPPAVSAAMSRFMAESAASPGRAAHPFAIRASRVLFETREVLARLFNCPRSEYIIFTPNVTQALNMALLGLLNQGDHVVTTGMEHNAVMRPLDYLVRSRGVRLSVVPCSRRGELDPDDLERTVTSHTRLIVMTHASNVTGTLMPLAEVARRKKNALLLVDAAQTAGVVPLDMQDGGIDLLAFTGHKALLGPTGTGGLGLIADLPIAPLVRGGTGSRSEFCEQPDFLPDRLESGTPNTIGLAGLLAGIQYIQSQGQERIWEHELQLTRLLLKELQDREYLQIYGPPTSEAHVAIISFNVKGRSPAEVARRLDREYGILTRSGLHCAPTAHHTLGTFPTGTVRLSLGYFNTAAECQRLLEALDDLARA